MGSYYAVQLTALNAGNTLAAVLSPHKNWFFSERKTLKEQQERAIFCKVTLTFSGMDRVPWNSIVS